MLIQRGFHLHGYNCLAANVMTLTSFNIKVCTSWFNGKEPFHKPNTRNSGMNGGCTYQLIPTYSGLYAIHYLALRDYALKLEVDRDIWFYRENWGMIVDSDRGTFKWRGGNTIEFPMTPVCHTKSLFLREQQYLANSSLEIGNIKT